MSPAMPDALRSRRSAWIPGLAVALSAALLVAGCDSLPGMGKKDTRPCPPAGVLRDASRLVQFQPGSGHDLTDIQFEANLRRVGATCSYDSSGVDVDLTLAIIAEQGAAFTGSKAPMSYFIAIVDPGKTVVAKRVFKTDVTFAKNEKRAAISEELTQRIPLPKGASAGGYGIVAGFQLTHAEIKFNRREENSPLPGQPGAHPLPTPTSKGVPQPNPYPGSPEEGRPLN